MRSSYICIYTMMTFLLFSCKQEAFQKGEQNPADYSKLVRISELVSLYTKDNNEPFIKPLYIEATVNGVDNRSIHIQDGSGIAIRVFIDDASTFNVNDLVRIPVGGEILVVDNAHYALNASQDVISVGFGSSTPSSATLEDIVENIHNFTSKVVNIDELTFTEKEERADVVAYLIEQNIAPDLNFWVNIPLEWEYEMPMSISSVRGYVLYENGNIYINPRTQDEVQEVYVEPTMMEKLLLNSTLVKNVLQSTEEEIAPGVKMSEMSYINNVDLLTSSTVLEVDLNNPKVKLEPGSPNESPAPTYGVIQSLSVMASHKNNSYQGTNWRVLAAITGDIHDGQVPNLKVRGPIIWNGAIYKTDFYSATHGFLGLRKDGGTPIMGNKAEFDQINKNDLQHVVGGIALLRDGQPVPNLAGNRDPRAAIGYTLDNKVYLFVGNGRDLSVGNGYTRQEIAEFLKALGCEGGLYLMEGGASVGIVEDANSGDYHPFSRTHATNPNHNPPLASSWMVVTERD